jgi:hypothetical protein
LAANGGAWPVNGGEKGRVSSFEDRNDDRALMSVLSRGQSISSKWWRDHFLDISDLF